MCGCHHVPFVSLWSCGLWHHVITWIVPPALYSTSRIRQPRRGWGHPSTWRLKSYTAATDTMQRFPFFPSTPSASLLLMRILSACAHAPLCPDCLSRKISLQSPIESMPDRHALDWARVYSAIVLERNRRPMSM